MVRKRIIVHGRVQGVGFRYHVYQQALRIGIHGWVKNLPDGTVEIDAEGPSSRMKQFVEAVKRGSPVSKVTHLDIRDEEPTGFQQFEIRY
jgi:acylphosphatase